MYFDMLNASYIHNRWFQDKDKWAQENCTLIKEIVSPFSLEKFELELESETGMVSTREPEGDELDDNILTST